MKDVKDGVGIGRVPTDSGPAAEMMHSIKINALWPALILLAAAMALYAVSVMAAGGHTIDDAYISARYAKNLAAYGQLTWNLHETPRTEGYTSPLWVLLSSLVFFITDGFPFHLIQLMSIFFGALALLMLFALGRKLRISPWSAALPPLFLSVSAPFVLWSASGMESAFYTFLVLLGMYLVLDEEDNGLNYITPLVFFLIFLARTEGLVFYLSVVAVRGGKCLLYADVGRNDLRKFLVWNAIFLLCFFTYLLWKVYYYEAVLPLPVYVKKPDGLAGFVYVADFLGYIAPSLVLALLGLRAGWSTRKLLLWVALGAYLLAISFSNPLMGWSFRLLVAAFPLIYLLAVWELDRVFLVENPHTLNRFLFGVIACLLFLTVLKDPGDYLDSLRRRATASAQVLGSVHVPLGQWLDRQPKKAGTKKVALADVGAVSFYFDGEVIDFYGLNDRKIAYEGFSARSVLERNPDYVILNSKNQATFEGNDSPCGIMSEEIFKSELFQKHYCFVRQFVTQKPFYSLWVYKWRH